MTVDAVLCEECIYYQGGGCMNRKVIGLGFWKPRMEEDFCSLGERRDHSE